MRRTARRKGARQDGPAHLGEASGFAELLCWCLVLLSHSCRPKRSCYFVRLLTGRWLLSRSCFAVLGMVDERVT